MTTSLRLDAAKLEALKIIALRKRVHVNDLVVEGIDHVIALNKENGGMIDVEGLRAAIATAVEALDDARSTADPAVRKAVLARTADALDVITGSRGMIDVKALRGTLQRARRTA
jgi:hypothetical protein